MSEMMNAEFLSTWIESAQVDKYEKEHKRIFVATQDNQQLILTCHQVEYPHGLHPHINVVLVSDGESELIYQDIVDEKFGQILHSTGSIYGPHTARENVETIFAALASHD